MTVFGQPLLDLALGITFAMLLFSFGASFVRMLIGPSLPDRVVALDLVSFIAVGFIGVYTIWSDEVAFLDVAIALALVAFLATVAFARYVERQAPNTSGEHDEHPAEGAPRDPRQ